MSWLCGTPKVALPSCRPLGHSRNTAPPTRVTNMPQGRPHTSCAHTSDTTSDSAREKFMTDVNSFSKMQTTMLPPTGAYCPALPFTPSWACHSNSCLSRPLYLFHTLNVPSNCIYLHNKQEYMSYIDPFLWLDLSAPDYSAKLFGQKFSTHKNCHNCGLTNVAIFVVAITYTCLWHSLNVLEHF